MARARRGIDRRLLSLKDCPLIDGLPTGNFGCILADPPWQFKSRTALQSNNWHSRRDAEKHYQVMTMADIAALPIRDLADPAGCHLFLWTTGPCLKQAFEVMEAWGFRYSTIAFTWAKLRRSFNPNQLRTLPSAAGDFHTGLGLTTRKNTELCLLGRRGSPKRVAKNVRELIVAPVREHSRKPEEARERIEAYAVGPYLDLFGRSQRAGWTVRGDESQKFEGTA